MWVIYARKLNCFIYLSTNCLPRLDVCHRWLLEPEKEYLLPNTINKVLNDLSTDEINGTNTTFRRHL